MLAANETPPPCWVFEIDDFDHPHPRARVGGNQRHYSLGRPQLVPVFGIDVAERFCALAVESSLVNTAEMLAAGISQCVEFVNVFEGILRIKRLNVLLNAQRLPPCTAAFGRPSSSVI